MGTFSDAYEGVESGFWRLSGYSRQFSVTFRFVLNIMIGNTYEVKYNHLAILRT